MNHHLSEISSQVAADAHAVVILDRAGWHRSQGLVIPANVTLLQLPPYSPELNPGERIWHYLRSLWLANTVFISLADVMDACEMAWNRFATNHRLIRSLARSPGLQLRPFTRSHLFGGPRSNLNPIQEFPKIRITLPFRVGFGPFEAHRGRCARRVEGPLSVELLSGNLPRRVFGIGADLPLLGQSTKGGGCPRKQPFAPQKFERAGK